MEEDIKVLEKYVEKDIPCNSCKYCAERPKVAGALRNLIKGYKELQVENLELLEKIEMKKILIMRKDHTTKEIFGELYIKKDDLEKDYIPKSKVQEKIETWESICRVEQLEGLNDNHTEYWSCFEDVLEKIKEQLLQEGDDK